MPFLKGIGEANTGLRIYELPTLGRRYRLMRSFIDGVMRAGIPDRGVRAATVTLYIDKSPFRRSLALRDEDRIYVFLVDCEGRVPAGLETSAARAERLSPISTHSGALIKGRRPGEGR